MNLNSESNESPVLERPDRSNKGWIAVAVIGATLIGSNVYFASRASDLEKQIKEARLSLKTDVAGLEQSQNALNVERSKEISDLRAKLDETTVKATRAANQAGQATTATKKYSEELNTELAKKLADQQEAQIAQHRALTAQLGEIKTDAEQTTTKVTGIATEVTGVKTEVAQTRSELERTISELKSVRGDMGVQSGLIATNSRELNALRALGERDYFEFALNKTKTPQRVGEIAIQLKKSDLKKNRFTIDLIANDKKVEKKDKGINEPVQFYMAKARIPYEIVVNEVRPDKIVGYLSAPKVRDAR